MPNVVGDSIDRLAAIEMRTKDPYRGVVTSLYTAIRKKSKSPLTMSAAKELVSRVKTGDYVFILTGAGSAPALPKGESDGPPGAASLARALDLGLQARPVYLCDEYQFDPIIAASEAIGIPIVDHKMRKKVIHGAEILSFPSDYDAAVSKSKELLNSFQPKAIIAVERFGPNEKGVHHSMGGYSISEIGLLHVLVEQARDQGILTIGIADNGNEIGCGLIHADVQSVQPFGKLCRCPCKSGIAAVTKTDILIFSSISNWGAYGLCACLAYLLENLDIMQDPYLEGRVLERCADAGALDGDLSLQVPSADLVSMQGHQAMVVLMREVVRLALIQRKEVITQNN